MTDTNNTAAKANAYYRNLTREEVGAISDAHDELFDAVMSMLEADAFEGVRDAIAARLSDAFLSIAESELGASPQSSDLI